MFTNDFKRTLVIFPGALGDLVCLLPSIEALAGHYPKARFELMAAAELARFFAGRSVFTAGHSIDRSEMASLFAEPAADLTPARQFFGRFSRVYSFFAFDNASYRQRLTRACEGRASFHRFRPIHPGHIAAGYAAELGLIAQLGTTSASDFSAPAPRARIFPTCADFAASQELLNAAGLRRKQFVILMPGSGSVGKNWPAEKFAALARATVKRVPCAILLGPAEQQLKAFFEKRGCVVFASLELPVAAALIACAMAFVGNDSGLSHTAAALGVPGVALFGPTEPVRWAPLGQVAIIARAELAALDYDEVAASLMAILDKLNAQHGRFAPSYRVDCPSALT
jgi:heptosyltransferase-3